MHWVLIPYIGLLIGHLSPTLMGLTHIDWLSSLRYGTGMIFVVIILFGLIRTTAIQPPTKPSQESVTTSPVLLLDPKNRRNSSPLLFTGLLSIIFVAGMQEFHWSFLRGACLEILLILAPNISLPAYSAIWLASALAGLELLTYKQSTVVLITIGVIMITTSILFFYTQNYWLCWGLHISGRLVLIRKAL